jgi:hypothetical protein
MISLPRRARTRRQIAAGMAVTLALGAVVVAKTQAVQAHEAITPYAFDCNLLGSALPITTTITTDHTPETIHAGDSVMLDVKTAPPAGITLDVPVTKVVITIPIPAQVDQTVPAQIMIMGGSLPGTGAVVGGNLVITLTGSVSSLAMQMPELMITSKLKTGIEGQTINWQGPSKLDITANVAVLGNVNVNCTTSASNPPVAVTPVAAGTTTTTVPATTRPATTVPATTRPATTVPATTRPATTVPATTRPATTVPATTRPATTVPATTRPATTRPPTTMRPTTTRPQGGPHIPDFIRRLLCRLFHIGC